jgi:hypothetical protein
VFPKIPRDAAKKIGEAGPTPGQLEICKQLALYSDCFDTSGGFVSHLPSLVDRRNEAWERLCEARAITLGLRDYPPEELEVWLEVFMRTKGEETDVCSVLRELHKELSEKGFVKEGWWDTLLRDAEEEARSLE